VAAVTRGEISVRTPYGVIARIEAGQFGRGSRGARCPAAAACRDAGSRERLCDAWRCWRCRPCARGVRQRSPDRHGNAAQGRGRYVEALSGTVLAQTASGEPRPVQVGDTF